MIVTEYKGKKLSNAASSLVIYFPRLAGKDALTAIQKNPDNLDIPTLILFYASFRMAGDPEARKMSAEDIINEVEVFNPDETKGFVDMLMPLLNETHPKKR